MENRKTIKKNLLQALLFSVVTGLANTISANASNDSIKTIAKQKTITATANTFDKLYPNSDKLEPVVPIGPVLPIDPGEPILPIHPDKPVVPTPPTSTSSTYDVGSPKGALSVNNSEAAVYSINISAPNGGGLTPSIGISYNNQSGNGWAGWGFNITGLSCITRGCKDLYHDRQIAGTSYGISDALFLNGQRLILKTGAYGYNGSTYTPEGDPYTIVTLHNNINTSACWFSVVCTDGKTYQLGNTSDSRLSFVNRKSVTCIAAWYINQTTDIHSNLVKYHYTTTNYNLRPISIEYGLNTAKSRGITNFILFTYSSLAGGSYARPFTIGDRQGKMDVYLSKITTQTNSSVFRTYTFTYNSTSDGTKDKYYRLIQLDLANGAGRKVSPIKINWDYLPSLYISNATLNVQTSSPSSMIEESAKTFIAVDVNNDGISDIIRLSPGAYVQRYNGGESRQEKTFLFISLSKKDANGNVTYQTPKQFDLNSSFSMGDLKLHVAGKGTVGFSSMTTENLTLGTRETTTVDKWDTDKWIPIQTTTTSTVGGNSSKIVSYTTIANNISGQNYYAYTSRKSLTDLDGNTSETYTTYDTAKGVPTVEIVKNDGDNMYKKVAYNSYIQKMTQWMPLNVVKSQKHEDDSEVNSSTTTYTYNDKGEVIKAVVNDGSTLPLTVNTTYDVYGNVLTSTQTGKGIVANTETNVYDTSGRFVVKAYDSVIPRVTTYTYDLFGNILTENDETNKTHILTSKHVYDGWGTEISETNSFGITTTKEMGWSSNYDKKYFITTSSTGKPWIAVWFDNAGHEVLQESVIQNANAYSLATTYNSKGQKTKIEEKIGKLTLSETFKYDERGRVTSDVKSSGKSSTFSYGNRSVTETTAGRSYTKVTDAWGNLVKSADPVTHVDYVYSSTGKPAEITVNGATTYIQYDEVGNKIAVQSPDAGNINYEYAADGKVMKFTDARNITTTYTYDAEGRLASTKAGNTLITNTYGTSGNSINHLVKTTVNGNSVEYTHDELGRVITETRTVSGDGTYQFKYAYNANNQLVQTTYPGNLIVKYTYDKYGNKTQTTANEKIVYQFDDYDGLETKTSFLNKYTTTFTLDSRGFKSDIVLKNDSIVLDQFKMNYDGATGNLLSRTRNSHSEETFGYDNLDRLVSVKVGTKETMHIKYAENGNITSKTGIGQYYYDAERPHAVASVDNTDNLISTQDCTTQFNDLNKISSLQENDKVMTIDYGPNLERCFSILKQGNMVLRKVTYMDDYEKIVANGVTREFYYLDGDVIIIRQNGTFHAYQLFKDNLGSILSVIDENGSKVFSAEYDAWGKQTVSVNTIGLIRGYGGHEMLNEFNLINMNGRVYDPVLGRFLSPDKYIQEGDNSQNYNSYSYCLNNPLKYADPSGDVFVLDDFIAITAMGAMMGAMNAAMSDKPIWKGALLGAASAAATYGIGQLFGVAGSFGRELLRAGTHGLSSGVFNALNGDNFWNGLISGAASSGMGSFAQSSNWNPYLLMASTTTAGGAIAWATGGDFLQGALNGLQIGAFNFVEHDGYDGNGGPGYVKRLPDGTLEAQEPLKEVVCKGIKIRPILNIPHEKPLAAVYPEFDILFFVRAAISEGFSSLLSSIVKHPEKSFFENTIYTGKVKRQILNNDYLSFPESVTAFEKNGQVIQIIGGDGIKRRKLTIP